MRRVWACDDCGEEWDETWAGDVCFLCGGPIIEVPSSLVALADLLEAVVQTGGPT